MEAINNSISELRKAAIDVQPFLQQLKNDCEANRDLIGEDLIERVLTLMTLQDVFIELIDGLKYCLPSDQEK